MNPAQRNGRFTSSEIWKLTTTDRKSQPFGAPGLKYIKTRGYERKLKRSVQTKADSKEMAWGVLCERYMFEKLPLEYKYQSDITLVHITHNYWAGSPDFLTEDTVGDAKCPFTMESFCDLIQWCSEGVEIFKANRPEYYWQLVSNAILTVRPYIELIVYVPSKLDLFEIQDFAAQQDFDKNRFAFIHWSDGSDLPWLPDDSDYESLNFFRFEPIDGDRELLTELVAKAEEMVG